MSERTWLIIINAAAGFYAASLWGFFAWTRIRSRRHLWAAIDVIACISSSLVGVAYLEAALTQTSPAGWLRWVVVPVLVLPASLHLASWMRARRFIADTQPGGNQ